MEDMMEYYDRALVDGLVTEENFTELAYAWGYSHPEEFEKILQEWFDNNIPFRLKSNSNNFFKEDMYFMVDAQKGKTNIFLSEDKDFEIEGRVIRRFFDNKMDLSDSIKNQFDREYRIVTIPSEVGMYINTCKENELRLIESLYYIGRRAESNYLDFADTWIINNQREYIVAFMMNNWETDVQYELSVTEVVDEIVDNGTPLEMFYVSFDEVLHTLDKKLLSMAIEETREENEIKFYKKF